MVEEDVGEVVEEEGDGEGVEEDVGEVVEEDGDGEGVEEDVGEVVEEAGGTWSGLLRKFSKKCDLLFSHMYNFVY